MEAEDEGEEEHRGEKEGRKRKRRNRGERSSDSPTLTIRTPLTRWPFVKSLNIPSGSVVFLLSSWFNTNPQWTVCSLDTLINWGDATAVTITALRPGKAFWGKCERKKKIRKYVDVCDSGRDEGRVSYRGIHQGTSGLFMLPERVRVRLYRRDFKLWCIPRSVICVQN